MAWATSSSIRPEPAPEALGGPPGRPRLAWVGSWPEALERSGLEQHAELRQLAPGELPGEPGRDDALLVDATGGGAGLHDVLVRLQGFGPGDRPVVVAVRTGSSAGRLDASRPDGVDEVADLRGGALELWHRVEAALRARRVTRELERTNAELKALTGQLEALARRMGDELRLAASVQRSLLPTPLAHPRLDAAWEFIPYREIGGDYFDLIPLPGERLALALGDVMGKGVPAALLAGNLKACLRAQLQGGELVPEQIVERVNRLFCDVSPRGLFATLFFGVLDPRARRLTYVNAGHDHPFAVGPRAEPVRLGDGGTVLGLMPESVYRGAELELGPEDLLVLYSDGVTDRTNPAGEAFGLERLCQSAWRVRRDPVRLALYSLLGEVQGFSEGVPAEDDLTLVALKLRA